MDLFSHLPTTFNTPGWLFPLVNSQIKKSVWLAVGLGVATWAWRDYRAWIAYGTGGFPPNVFVWAFMTLVRFTRFVLLQDGRNPAQLRTKGPKAEEEGRRLLADLERREDRPQTNARPLPHRHQCQEVAPLDFATLIETYLKQLAITNPDLLSFASHSNLERSGPALLVAPTSDYPRGQPETLAWGQGEICHLHGQDGSLHVALSKADAREVVEKSWGERFPLAGVIGRIPVGYVMLYAPRNQRELDVVKNILLAGCGWMAGEGVKDE